MSKYLILDDDHPISKSKPLELTMRQWLICLYDLEIDEIDEIDEAYKVDGVNSDPNNDKIIKDFKDRPNQLKPNYKLMSTEVNSHGYYEYCRVVFKLLGKYYLYEYYIDSYQTNSHLSIASELIEVEPRQKTITTYEPV